MINKLKQYKWIKSVTLLSFLIIINSCKTTTPSYNYQSLAKASILLGIDIDMEDNHHLYIELSKWMRTPHWLGGNSKQGIDCSGFTHHIYKTVYKKNIPRNSHQQYSKSKKTSRKSLKEGDLVFFSTSRSRKRVNHVGIYLKNNLFIHTSSSKGVIISNLNENYFRRNWVSGGRF